MLTGHFQSLTLKNTIIMPFCTMCGAKMTPEAKFCGSCGTAVELVENQQVSPQQAAPSQPQYQQAPPQQVVPSLLNKTKIDRLPNAEHNKTLRFMWAGIVGALISVAMLFVSRTSGWHLNSTYYAMTIVSQGFACIAMVNIFYSLRKGLEGYPVAMPQLLKATATLNMVIAGIIIVAAVLVLLGGLGISKLVRTLGDVCSIASLAYLVCFVIVAVKLLGAYEGKMKTMAITLLVIPGITLLMVLLEMGSRGRTDALTVLFTLGVQGASCYLYYLSYQIFTGKRLF